MEHILKQEILYESAQTQVEGLIPRKFSFVTLSNSPAEQLSPRKERR